MKILILLLLASCAAVNPFAYNGVMTPSECRAQCASRAYPMIEVRDGFCVCDTRNCMRSRNHGGCEQLPSVPGASAPTTQM
ncbi:MAG: hypothetical protein ACREMO_08660 [Gemmatimonadales bacterium]